MPSTAPRKARAGTGTAAANANATTRPRALVRMYLHGLGDCFLIRLPHPKGKDGWFSIMLDCGILLGTKDAKAKMVEVVEDVAKTTGGRLDLLAVTHEHWDHVSGFVQAKDVFAAKLTEVDAVWAGWTEDESDPQVKALQAGRQRTVAALQAAGRRLHELGLAAAGDPKECARLAGAAEEVSNLLGFFGIEGLLGAAGGTTRDAMRNALAMSGNVRFCKPTDEPYQPEGADWRIYVLGPPLDQKMLKKSDPSGRAPETYPLAASAEGLAAALGGGATNARPFNQVWAIPDAEARTMDFFRDQYYEGPDWRGIHGDWLGTPGELALKLDSDTNNTSLVLAIELPPATEGGEPDVLLFAADAQVGNWLSWQGLSWTVDGRTVTGPDLLRRTTVYKVGHHGSHNATLREKGLELMERLQVALIPVDKKAAEGKNWKYMPRNSILERLREMTELVLRSDEEAADSPSLTKTALCYEVAL